MLRRLLTLLLLCCAMDIVAQDFRTPWIACPSAMPNEQVWFREVLELDEQPAEAWLSVMTKGYVQVYINERNIATDIRMPYREEPCDSDALGMRYNIRRFLSAGRNVIAIHYSPTIFLPLGEVRRGFHHQIAAHLWGHYANGSAFALQTDDDWLCRPANAALNAQTSESIDGRQSKTPWKSDDAELALWQPAIECSSPAEPFDDEEQAGWYPTEHITEILTPSFIETGNNRAYYIFNTAFEGWVRVTIRKATPGQHVYIDGMEYVCNGEYDEQACQRFTVGPHRIVVISGDDNFLPEQITCVEGLAIQPSPYSSTP